MEALALILLSLVVGGGIGWVIALRRLRDEISASSGRAFMAETRVASAEAQAAEARRRTEEIGDEIKALQARLDAEMQARVEAATQRDGLRGQLAEQTRMLGDAEAKLSSTFKALAGESLEKSTQSFLALARETFERVLAEAKGDLGKREAAIGGLVQPLAETLKSFDAQVRSLEVSRQQAYASLETQLKTLGVSQEKLQKETAGLVTALRKPEVRGRWGEMTLKRVVELAGLSEHCDFSEQASLLTEQGARVRPDLVVHLPAGREIVVDAKVPLAAYLDAHVAGSDEERAAALARHVGQIRAHMSGLSAKTYWDQFSTTPEFVVMFIPGESFFAAAADLDHALIEDGMQKRVVLATPTTLIALLHAVAYGWKQEQLAKNAQAISEIGRQLHERMRTLAGHLGDIGKSLGKAGDAYNSAVGSLESRVMPAARRLKELGAGSGEEIEALEPVEKQLRQLSLVETKRE
jgi:DNA recombination protein RmuC